jgi:LacI family transcriptional regulator
MLYIPGAAASDWTDVDFSNVDGILACGTHREMENRILASGKPAVAVATNGEPCLIPHVTYHEQAIGRMAGEHLAGLGLKDLAFVGFTAAFSRQREDGFVEFAASKGLQAPRRFAEVECSSDWVAPFSPVRRSLLAWVKRLELSVGIFCATDVFGSVVLRCRQEAGLEVPAEVSVIGVDNVTWTCETATVPMSSIDRGTDRAGYEAAHLLARLIRGQSTQTNAFRIQPERVAIRRSTEMLDPDNPELTQAVHFIRDYACDGITIHDLLEAVPISRRSLHRQFEKFLGYSPGEAIQRQRLDRAKRLLLETNIPLADVAARCGFGWSTGLGRAFRARYGVTPATFRLQAKNGMSSAAANRPQHEKGDV